LERVNAYSVSGEPTAPRVNGQPVVFFHFHQLRIVDCGRHRFTAAIHAIGYDFNEDVGGLIYRAYVQRLRKESVRLATLGIPLRSDQALDVRSFLIRLLGKRIDMVNPALGCRCVLSRFCRGSKVYFGFVEPFPVAL
jgi:hypothetical protein